MQNHQQDKPPLLLPLLPPIEDDAKPKKEFKNKMGRPQKSIDPDQLDKLLHIQCTLEEVASFFDVSIATIERRVLEWYGTTFVEYANAKRAVGRISLRRKQFQVALDGNVTMLIWLGKQVLQQSDKTEVSLPDHTAPVTLAYQARRERSVAKIIVAEPKNAKRPEDQ